MFYRPRFRMLFEPFQVGRVKLRNRIVRAPTSMDFSDTNEYVTERVKDYFEALAKGGVGLVITEGIHIDSRASKGLHRLVIDDDKFIPGLHELAEVIHRHGCPVFLQLNHPGPTQPQKITGSQPVASTSLDRDEKVARSLDRARALSIADIEELIDKFAKGGARAQKAGFDGVEIHGAHNYLINSFLSRAWNKRQDVYGCQDLGNRARFAVEIIQAIKRRTGQDFPVGMRFNGGEWGVETGITADESQGFGKTFEEAGADYVHISGFGYGAYYGVSRPEQFLYPEPTKEIMSLVKKIKKPGVLVTRAQAIKKVVSIPVIGVGRLDPKLGEWLLRKGKVDLIAFSRRLLADPELPNKVAAGRLEDIAPCTACLHCINNFSLNKPVICRINAVLGREREYVIGSAGNKKKVLVVGGGPAGMEAARVAALRGHEVILYEKERKLGGLLPLAALIKGIDIEDLPALIRYLKWQITKLGVKVRLGEEANVRTIEEIKPDVVILATGGRLTLPEIQGIKNPRVMTSAELHQKAKLPLMLFGPKLLRWLTKFWLPIRKQVVIFGGLIHGCEIAEFLVKRGRRVTILETSDQLGTGIIEMNKARLLPWLAAKGVNMLTGVKHAEVTDQGVIIIDKEGNKQVFQADTVLIATPPVPNAELVNNLKGKVPEVHIIGDAKDPRLIIDAVADGLHIGRTI